MNGEGLHRSKIPYVVVILRRSPRQSKAKTSASNTVSVIVVISTQEEVFDVSVYLGALLVTWWTSDDKSRFRCVVGGSGRAWKVSALRRKANHDVLVAELSRMLMRSHSLNTDQIRSSGQRHRDSRWSEFP